MTNFNYLGMYLGWWFFWIGIIVWIFIMPYDIPGQRNSRVRKHYILSKRYAQGQISTQEYLERKKILENK